MKLALFDLDHTLLPIDSDYSWGVYTTDISFGRTFFLFVNGRVVQMQEGSAGERLCARLGRMPEGITAP